MHIRQPVQLLVFAKYFNVVNFYSKGQYAMRIHVSTSEVDSPKAIIRGHPFVSQGKENRRNDNKKARAVLVANDEGKDEKDSSHTITQSFYVTFNEERIILSAAHLFQFELEPHKDYQTCIDFQLVCITYKNATNIKLTSLPSTTSNECPLSPSGDQSQALDRKITIVDSRKIFLTNPRDTHCYKRVIFEECDYFSYSDVLIKSCKLGEKIRRNPISLNSFSLMTKEEQIKQIRQKQEFKVQGEKWQRFSGIFNAELGYFYKKMISDKIQLYRKLVEQYNKLQMSMVSLNNSSFIQIEDQNIGTLDYIDLTPQFEKQIEMHRHKLSAKNKKNAKNAENKKNAGGRKKDRPKLQLHLDITSSSEDDQNEAQQRLLKTTVKTEAVKASPPLSSEGGEAQIISSMLYNSYECEQGNSSKLQFLLYEYHSLLNINKDSQEILRNCKYIWQKYQELLSIINFNVFESIANAHIQEEQQLIKNQLIVYQRLIKQQDRDNKRKQFILKRKLILSKLQAYEDQDIYHPLIILENFHNYPEPPSTGNARTIEHEPPKYQGNHEKIAATHPVTFQVDALVIFVHGYQGSELDLEKARNFMNLHNQFSHGLLINTIQDDMDESIEHLGKLLAEEVKLHIMNSPNIYKRINFIGYSLGGVVARESLKHLDKYKDIMNIFVSFASPHIGVTETQNFLVRTGIWFLTRSDKAKNLKQLNCEPDQNEQVTLMKLSECQSLNWFSRFVVVSSREDDFVPYKSSRLDDQDLSDMSRSICLNIKKRIKKLERMEVWFDVDHDTGHMDKMLGRKSHIQFLQNRIFLDSFFSVYASLF